MFDCCLKITMADLGKIGLEMREGLEDEDFRELNS